MPAVNFDLMHRAMVRETGGGFNQIVHWSGLPDWKNQTLTPNPDSIYLMAFTDTKGVGPIVLEIPPAGDGSITGTVMDCWQAPIEDVGPAGVDKGEGGRYLVLPSGYADELPAGYIPMRSDTYSGFALLRSILRGRGEGDVARAVAFDGRSGSTRLRRQTSRRRPFSSMRSTSCLTRRFPTTAGSSIRSTG